MSDLGRETVVWRCGRRSWLTAALWLAVAVALYWLNRDFDAFSVLALTCGAAVAAAHYAGLALRGRTELTEDGLRTRVWRTRVLPWSKVTSVRIEDAGFGSKVSVGGASKRPTPLAAPRRGPITPDPSFEDRVDELRRRYVDATGDPGGRSRHRHPGWAIGCALLVPLVMLVAFASFDKPWLDGDWPGVHHAAATPAPCDVLDDDVLRDALGTDYMTGGTSTDTYCVWSSATGTLSISYSRYGDNFIDPEGTAVDAIHRNTGQDSVPVPGLGDEAYYLSYSSSLEIRVRLANVIAYIDYLGTEDMGDHRDVVIAVARKAIGAVQLS